MLKTTLDQQTLTVFPSGRIDSSNAAEFESDLFAAVQAAPGLNICVDVRDLTYISSAGLRVLMKLRKKMGVSLPVVSASSEVYSIFEVTGFIQLFDVQKAIRELSVEGLPVVGTGATAKVYKLDGETVVKVFNPNTSMQVIKQENERSKNAFLHGIPTAISYDLVKVGDCFGTVYEMIDAQDFLAVLEKDKEHLDDHVRRFALAMKKMHQIEVEPDKFPPTKTGCLKVLPMLSGVCTQEEIEKLRLLFSSVPDRNTFIHGDCHPGNVMVQNGEFVFIDLMTCGSGHPVFDFGSICTVYHLPPDGNKAVSPLVKNFTREEAARIWDVYLRSYLESDDEEYVRKVERQVVAVSAARTLFAAVFIPGLLTEERIAFLKKTAFSYVDEGIEPFTF